MSVIVLSDIVYKLDAVHKAKYLQKIQDVGLQHDLYLLPQGIYAESDQVAVIPELQYPDIYNYFVSTASSYNYEEMKTH